MIPQYNARKCLYMFIVPVQVQYDNTTPNSKQIDTFDDTARKKNNFEKFVFWKKFSTF